MLSRRTLIWSLSVLAGAAATDASWPSTKPEVAVTLGLTALVTVAAALHDLIPRSDEDSSSRDDDRPRP
jgi:hypothetical protein